MHIPYQVGKRIEYLLQHGRRVEALALLAIEWNQVDLITAEMKSAWYSFSLKIGTALIPALDQTVESMARFGKAIKAYNER